MTDDAAIFAITLCYAALGTAVLMIVVRLVSRKLPAMLAILVLTCFYFVVFFSLQGLRGWSAPVAVPDRFQVLWTRVIEPNAVLNRRGATHLWLEELDEQNLPSGEPRAYVLPYSKALAYNVATAQAEIKKGHAQAGRAQLFGGAQGAALPEGLTVRTVTQGASPGGDPSGGGLLDPTALGGQSKSIDLMPLPPPALPPKDAP